MQQIKSIKNLSEISNYRECNDFTVSTFNRILSAFNLGAINKMLNKSKSKGINGSELFRLLFIIPFIGFKNIHQVFNSGNKTELTFDDNSYYRFLNNPNINWRGILYNFSQQFLKQIKNHTVDTQDDTPKCFIIDDTQFNKTGKMIEGIGKVYDHVSHKYELGIKLLLLGYWEGKSFLPIDFTVHNESGKNKKRGLRSKELDKQYSKERDPSSHGALRFAQISKSKIDTAISMIKQAVQKGFHCDYVLADSWFISELFLKKISALKNKSGKLLQVIGLIKTSRIVIINKKKYKLNTLSKLKRTQIKRCKKLSCHYISLDCIYKGLPVKIFLVRMKGQQNWKALCSTDQNISFIETMKLYQIRWSIEVAFKDMKQFLNFGKCQSKDFDAHIASITITCINYIALAFAKRFDDYESMGLLFLSVKDILLQDHLVKKLWAVIIQIYVECFAELGASLEVFIHKVINSNGLNNIISNLFGAMLSLNSY
jgi:hypothetical protein